MGTHHDHYLLFLDLETTDLDPRSGEIAEVAAILATVNLDEIERLNTPVQVSPEGIAAILAGPVADMHTVNGLVRDCMAATATLAEVEQSILDMLERHHVPPGRSVSISGSGVAHFDLRWVNYHMPRLASRLTYFAGVDTSSMRRSYRWWNGTDLVPDNEFKTHRAMDDLECHLSEARAFRAMFQRAAAP